MKKYFLFLFIIGGLTISFLQSNSFTVSKNNLSKDIIFQSDTPIVVRTSRARLGTSAFYVQKPEDCIENVAREVFYSREYSFSLRTKPAGVLHGDCWIIIAPTYYSRLKYHQNEMTFRDTIFGRAVTVKEYSKIVDLKNVAKGTEIIRECEFSVNSVFFYIRASGFSSAEVQKYYTIGRSLSN